LLEKPQKTEARGIKVVSYYTNFLGSIKRAIKVKIEVIIITQITKYQLFLKEFSVAFKA